ncbi:MAG: branched-chain amino acid transaminase [Gaiellaceae bacterium]
MSRPAYLSMDGTVVPYEDATVHVLSTAFKYGITVYEGLRAYWQPEDGELYVFRVAEHFRRLARSAAIARVPVLPAVDVEREILDLIRANESKEDLHIRVLFFVAADDGYPWSSEPTGRAVAAMPMGRFPGTDPGSDGVHVAISHWQRLRDASSPPRAKVAANYFNSRLAYVRAREDGYDDAVLLDGEGRVTEGPGYNIFLVRDGQIVTPPVTAGILEGVTRDSVIRLLADVHGTAVVERPVDKTELYIADEAFFCGSAKEIVPILSVDRTTLGEGQPGPVTRLVRETYGDVVRGRSPRYASWLTPVYASDRLETSV